MAQSPIQPIQAAAALRLPSQRAAGNKISGKTMAALNTGSPHRLPASGHHLVEAYSDSQNKDLLMAFFASFFSSTS
jgi:hypothetical protein